MNRRLQVFALLLAVLAPASRADAQTLRTVPSDHWAYSIADELLLRHPELGSGIFHGARPWRERDFVTIVERAREADLDGRAGAWVALLEEAFASDTVRYAEGTVSVHNEVSLIGQGVASKDDAGFEPAFQTPEFDADLGDPPARAVGQHDFAVQYDDRFALGWRYAIDSNVRNDPTRFRQLEVREGSEAGFAVLDAYGVFHWGPVWVTAGRNELSFGPGETSSVFISDSIPPIDHVRLELYGGETARFTGIVGRLSSDPQNRSFLDDGRVDEGSDPPAEGRQEIDRLLYLHRLDWQAAPWLQVAVSEAALATGLDRGLEFRYANLLVPFFVTQQDEDDEDGVNTNIFVNVEGTILAPGGFRAWGDVFVQEFFIDEEKRDEIGNQLAYKFGAEWADALTIPGVTVGAEYSRVDVFMYLHRGLNTNWSQYGVPIGSMMGPDADQGHAWVTYWPTPTLRVTADALARRGGDRSIESLESTIGAGNPDFPSGTVQRELRAGLEVWGLLPEWGVEGTARVSYADVNEVEGVEAGSVAERFWRAAVGLRWRWSFR